MGLGPTNRAGSSKTHISGAATTAVKPSTGVLRRIVITESVANTIVVNDNLGIVASFVASAAVGTYEFDCVCVGKIEVVTAGASKLTVVWD